MTLLQPTLSPNICSSELGVPISNSRITPATEVHTSPWGWSSAQHQMPHCIQQHSEGTGDAHTCGMCPRLDSATPIYSAFQKEESQSMFFFHMAKLSCHAVFTAEHFPRCQFCSSGLDAIPWAWCVAVGWRHNEQSQLCRYTRISTAVPPFVSHTVPGEGSYSRWCGSP